MIYLFTKKYDCYQYNGTKKNAQEIIDNGVQAGHEDIRLGDWNKKLGFILFFSEGHTLVERDMWVCFSTEDEDIQILSPTAFKSSYGVKR